MSDTQQIVLPETKGSRVVKFIENFCVHGEGDFYGEKFLLDDWQKAIIYELYEVNKNGSRKFREALIGLPKGNGKTALSACIGLYELLGSGVTSPLVAVAAASYEQANLVFGTMKTMCNESPLLQDMVITYENEIQVKNASGRAFRVAAKAGTADGGRNSCFIADEIHEWNNINLERVHYVLSNNTAKRRDGLVLNITTAGHDLDSMAGKMYQRGLLKESGKQEDPEFYFKWIGATDDQDPSDEKLWEAVNPAITNDWWPVENLRRRHKSLPINEFQRYHLNQWTRTEEESWIKAENWLSCQDTQLELEQGEETFVGIDMALRHDSVAIVYGQKDDNEVVNMKAKIWKPEDQVYMDYQEIEAYVIELMKLYKVKEVAYDPAFFERSAQVLLDRGVPMVNFPQTHSRMIPACGNAYDMIVNNKVRHDGDPTFTDQVMSAAQKITDMGWRLSKGRSKRKIDACIAMVLMLDRITAPIPEEDDPEVSIINL
jgi:phage terminase large subunit-like protein